MEDIQCISLEGKSSGHTALGTVCFAMVKRSSTGCMETSKITTMSSDIGHTISS